MRRSPAALAALTSRPELRRALASYTLYAVVEVLVWVATVLYAFAEGGAPLAGLVAVAQLVPAAVLSPVIVSRIEHLPRGAALAGAQAAVALASLATTAALLANLPVPVVIVTTTIMCTAIAVVRPLYFASLPQLADSPTALVSANSLSSVADGASFFLGPVLAGIGTEAVGTWFVFAGATVFAVLATVLSLGLGLSAPASETTGGASSWLDAVRSLGTLWGEWGALALLAAMATRFVVGGALDILGVSFSEDVLGRGSAGAGLIIGAIGIGGLVGAVVAGPAAMRRRLAPIATIGGVVQGLSLAAVALVSLLVPAVLLLVLCGIGGAVLTVAGRTLLQRTTDDHVLARVFAVQEGTSLLGWALGSAVAPLVISRTSPAGAFVPFGIGCTLVVLVAYAAIRRLDQRAVLRPVEVDLLRKVPFLAVLPVYELERLAQHTSWRDVVAGEQVIRQGESGDAFFVVADGEFAVTVDGQTVSGTLGPGSGFGEVALLRAVPRTATVTALTPGRLLQVGSDDFLAAVTGSVDGNAIAHEISDAYDRRSASLDD